MSLSRRTFIKLTATAAAACIAPSFVTGCQSTDTGTAKTSTTTAADTTSGSSSATTTSTTDDGAVTGNMFAFDTYLSFKAYCDQDLLDKVMDRCNYFEGIFSRTLEGTDVWNINNAAGKPVEVADETADIITKALDYCGRTDGLFDITIGAATTLWDFDESIIPDPDELAEAIKHIDYTKVHVDGNTVTLDDPDAKIDLGGIAKGYIADDLAALFSEGGCTSALINLGGNVYVVGTKPDGEDWNIGIQNPNETTGAIIATVEVADQTVVTSGLYERCFTKDGVLYYHILDPKTGYPVKTDLKASSIITKKSTDGDAYSTILFLSGSEKAMEILESEDFLEGLLVDDDDNITMSSGCTAVLV